MDPWSVGASVILYNGKKDASIWPKLIQQYKVTVFAAVPTVYRQILKHTDLSLYDLSSLRHGLTAGEALSPNLLDKWRAKAKTELFEALGMTEISTYISSGPNTPIKPGSPGKPQKGRQIVILPIKGETEPLPPNHKGLIAIHRSDPGLMLGYWERPEEEQSVFRGDWFVGGDLAEMDQEGYIWFHARSNDIMNTFGYRVSPLEVERILIHHPDIVDVAVGEKRISEDVSIIAACVVLREGSVVDQNTLLEWAKSQMADYKCPREIAFVDSLPYTANGKLLRNQLNFC